MPEIVERTRVLEAVPALREILLDEIQVVSRRVELRLGVLVRQLELLEGRLGHDAVDVQRSVAVDVLLGAVEADLGDGETVPALFKLTMSGTRRILATVARFHDLPGLDRDLLDDAGDSGGLISTSCGGRPIRSPPPS